MAIEQLTPEQARDWTAAQKDRWWLENVYRGDMPQLTLRAAATGFTASRIWACGPAVTPTRSGVRAWARTRAGAATRPVAAPARSVRRSSARMP